MAYEYLDGDGDGQYAIPRWARGPGGYQGQYVDPSKGWRAPLGATPTLHVGAGTVSTTAFVDPAAVDPLHPTRVASVPPSPGAGPSPSRFPGLLVLAGVAVLGVVVVRKIQARK